MALGFLKAGMERGLTRAAPALERGGGFAEKAYMHLGGLGAKGKGLEEAAQRARGKRFAFWGGAAVGASQIRKVTGIASGSRGTAPRSMGGSTGY